MATSEKILKEKFVDVFSLLLKELGGKDKEDLEDRDKERVKRNWECK